MTASKVQYARGWRKRKDVKAMSKSSDGGKGSSPRPYSVSQEEYAKRWDMIFGRDLDEEETPELEEAEEEDSLQCPKCGGVDTMYRRPHWNYNMCDQCGWTERLPAEEP